MTMLRLNASRRNAGKTVRRPKSVKLDKTLVMMITKTALEVKMLLRGHSLGEWLTV